MLQEIDHTDIEPYARNIMMNPVPEMPLLTLGARSYLVNGTVHYMTDAAHILVGSYSSLGHWIDFYIGMNHDYHHLTTYPLRVLRTGSAEPDGMPAGEDNRYQIVIGSDVWIGGDVTIMSGVHIGSGAVIGAGTVVAKDVPPYAVAVGNPMRIIKYRFDAETVAALLRIRWWDWPTEQVEEFVPRFEADLPGFVRQFDPGREEREDEMADAIHALRGEGYTVSYFVPDFSALQERAVWPHVVEGFLASYRAEDRAALVLSVPDAAGADACAETIAARLAAEGEGAPLILSHTCAAGASFSVAALSAADAYITTREAVCARAADYAMDAGVAVRYGRDPRALLFPPVR